ncbi:hypothetical protein ACFY93_14805 [Streptomyces sp. NPDC008313]|uniref:effector-associated domain 2-containing protein n=1 Tax=Streptomyces sp. NPDC008313 TaxID=3364826 RepID=UPI0036E44C1B
MTLPPPRSPGTPRSVTALPPISNLPDRSLFFEARDEEIAALLKLLNTYGQVLLHDDPAPPQGFGKTQTAIEYAYRFTHRYDVAWLFSCEGETDDAQLCGLMDEQYRQLWKRWDQEYGAPPEGRPDKRCLFVYDNVQDPDRIHEHFFPGRGHRLITSRSPGRTWGENRLQLGGMTTTQSEALLMQHASELDPTQAEFLAAQLRGHPGLLLTWAEEVIRTDFATCARALDGNSDTDPATPPGGIPVLTHGSAGTGTWSERRTLIEALVRSPVGRSRETYDVWLETVALMTGTQIPVNDSGVLRNRIVSLVNFALHQDTSDVLAALAGALGDLGGEERDTVAVRQLVDKAVKAWDGKQQR